MSLKYEPASEPLHISTGSGGHRSGAAEGLITPTKPNGANCETHRVEFGSLCS